MSDGGAAPPDDTFADQAFAVAADAYARSTSDSWERAVHAAIARLFGFLAERPLETRTCVVRDCGAGPRALGQRDRAIDRFAQLLQPGFAAAATPPPPVVAEAITGGIYELVRSHVLERRLGELPDAVPDATIVALAPFLGTAGAIDLVDSTKLQTGH
ncbi:MAG TPA: hypothetical protein VHF88_05890 [Thermoleophilaceae bacterium]|nr:hypothetical protein [Thermoleophilaceae bacterium]